MPHLFVSWSEEILLIEFLQDLIQQFITPYKAGFVDLAICSPATLILDSIKADFAKRGSNLLLRDQNDLTISRLTFLKALRKELHKRIKKQNSQQTPIYIKPLIVIVDDLIDLVITKNKQTGLFFLELMREGPKVKIHIIMGSTRTYRGLVRQLIQYEKPEEPSILDNYLPEVVISPEGLLFYKRPEELNYTRLFSVHEGER